MTNRSICMLARLVLVVFCTAGLAAGSPILFRDNFNRSASAAKWAVGDGTWTFERGKLIGVAESSDAWIYVAEKQFPGDIVVEAIYDQTATGNTDILFNSTGHLDNMYRVGIASKANAFFPDRWTVAVYQNGVVRNLIPPDATDVADGMIASPFPIPTRGRVRVRRLGNTITIYVNRKQVGSVTDSDALPARGKVGLLVVSNATTTFDNFEVRSVHR
jgi:hypothetical protein